MLIRPLVALTTGVLALGGAALSLASAADAAPQPKPTTSNASAAPDPTTPAAPIRTSRPSASAEPTTSNRAPSSVPATPPAPSTGDGGAIDVPAGHVTITRHDADPALPLALGGAGVLLVAGGATAAVRRRR